MKKRFTGKEIKIIYNDKYTIAIDLKTGKKGIAKCNPVDKFDEITGAKIAISRLRESSNKIDIGDVLEYRALGLCGPVVYISKEKTPAGSTQCVINSDGMLFPLFYPSPDVEYVGHELDKFQKEYIMNVARNINSKEG